MRSALILGALLLGAPVWAQQPASGQALYFSKDPNPATPPTTTVTPPNPPAAQTPPKQDEKSPLPPTPTLEFSKEAQAKPGTAPAVTPPSLHFTKDASGSSPTPPPLAKKEAPPVKKEVPPVTAPDLAPPSSHFTKNASTLAVSAPLALPVIKEGPIVTAPGPVLTPPPVITEASITAVPPASPQAPMVKDSATTPRPTSTVPPVMHFTKEAETVVAPAPAPSPLYFSKEAAPSVPAPRPAPTAPPVMYVNKEAPAAVAPAPTPPSYFNREAAPTASRLPPARPVSPPTFRPGSVQVAMQQPAVQPLPGGQAPDEETYIVQLTPPGPQRVFRLESEAAFRERMRQEARQRGQRTPVDFPPEPIVSTESFTGRNNPPMSEIVEPGYVCYGRLYFEERNAERYDWDLGIMQPLVSLGYFYKDVIMYPYHCFTDPCRKFDCDAGYCLPGDPTPYLLYPPAISVTGAIGEAAAILTVIALLPG